MSDEVVANRRYRNQVTRSVERAMEQFNDSASVDTPTMKGRIREIAIEKILEPLLFEHLRLGKGKVTDYLGHESAEFDSAIYSTRCLAALMHEEKLGIYPADSVLFAIEIKSTISASEIRDSLHKAKSLRPLKYTTGTYQERNGIRTDNWFPLYPVLFAFRSDLGTNGKSEIERYLELDEHGATNPLFQMLCVIGRGFWWFCRPEASPGRWIFHEPTDQYDEVVDFTAIALKWATELLNLRMLPTMAPYLIDLHIKDDGTVTRRT